MKRFSFGVRPCGQKDDAATGGLKERNTAVLSEKGADGGKKPYGAKEKGEKRDVQADTPRISAFFWCAFIALFPVAGLAYLIVRAMYEKNSSLRNMAVHFFCCGARCCFSVRHRYWAQYICWML